MGAPDAAHVRGQDWRSTVEQFLKAKPSHQQVLKTRAVFPPCTTDAPVRSPSWPSWCSPPPSHLEPDRRRGTCLDIEVLDTKVNPANNHTYHLLSASSWTEAAQAARGSKASSSRWTTKQKTRGCTKRGATTETSRAICGPASTMPRKKASFAGMTARPTSTVSGAKIQPEHDR